jgi:hypothetical protein
LHTQVYCSIIYNGHALETVHVFIFIYENKRRKPVEIFLRDREEGRGRMMERINLTKMHCEHIGKYHNVSPCATIKS